MRGPPDRRDPFAVFVCIAVFLHCSFFALRFFVLQFFLRCVLFAAVFFALQFFLRCSLFRIIKGKDVDWGGLGWDRVG